MLSPRISASSYSNTAPLVWSFLYGSNHGKVEIVLDNAPARSAELLAQNRVDAALVPMIASQFIDDVRLIPNVCVGVRECVRSVCLVTKGSELKDVRSVALDISSKTSVVLTKIIFREFLGFEPVWCETKPDINAMLADSDAALLIGDPALAIALSEQRAIAKRLLNPDSEIPNLRFYDLAELWHQYTGLGFVFAMWMTRRKIVEIDFAAARDEGLTHIDEIAANYAPDLKMELKDMKRYLSENISYSIDESMEKGMQLYIKLAGKCGLIDTIRPMRFL